MKTCNHTETQQREIHTREETTAGRATARRHFARGFARRVIVWAVTCAFLAVVNRLPSPHYWWVLWVIAGWGLQLLLALLFYLFGDEKE